MLLQFRWNATEVLYVAIELFLSASPVCPTVLVKYGSHQTNDGI